MDPNGGAITCNDKNMSEKEQSKIWYGLKNLRKNGALLYDISENPDGLYLK